MNRKRVTYRGTFIVEGDAAPVNRCPYYGWRGIIKEGAAWPEDGREPRNDAAPRVHETNDYIWFPPAYGFHDVLPPLIAAPKLIYTKCVYCPLYVDYNDVEGAGTEYAKYIHLMNDDRPVDVIFDEWHEPEPSNLGPQPKEVWMKDREFRVYQEYLTLWMLNEENA